MENMWYALSCATNTAVKYWVTNDPQAIDALRSVQLMAKALEEALAKEFLEGNMAPVDNEGKCL